MICCVILIDPHSIIPLQWLPSLVLLMPDYSSNQHVYVTSKHYRELECSHKSCFGSHCHHISRASEFLVANEIDMFQTVESEQISQEANPHQQSHPCHSSSYLKIPFNVKYNPKHQYPQCLHADIPINCPCADICTCNNKCHCGWFCMV